MSARAVLSSFERYQKERVAFVKSVAEMAKAAQVGTFSFGVGCSHSRPLIYNYAKHAMQNIEALHQAGAMQLLRPLLLDNVQRFAPCGLSLIHI